tara:strand:+ start:1113 stop:1277 length:165 start_codon:yes stop_codon:yes gene_type:complete
MELEKKKKVVRKPTEKQLAKAEKYMKDFNTDLLKMCPPSLRGTLIQTLKNIETP